ncbi:AbrB/MazE/SpoVT family DNA-binding domain-containing protein [Candidatus Roizmanbacteria bacterium]|nr:AbrB/MazE/SpoVT family DNA-binding domain-containing protein [Candidatus Roizmanbacteria bacterium]
MEQTVYKSGSSLVVVVPSEFIEIIGVKNGDKVKVAVDYDHGVIHYYFSGAQQLTLTQTLPKHTRRKS